jgi:hypothetical protein
LVEVRRVGGEERSEEVGERARRSAKRDALARTKGYITYSITCSYHDELKSVEGGD